MDHSHIFGGHTPSVVFCCECGTELLTPNRANMCVNCIRSKEDITEGIPKQTELFWCKGCNRYLDPPNKWVFAELESKELLSFCLKKLKGLKEVKLIDASFIFTEHHSKRIKTKLTIQKEVYSSVILQEIFIVEYVVHSHFCDDCHQREADKTWNSVLQVRQRVNHKRTFYWLEQVILKHRAHDTTTFIEEYPDGLDFYFSHVSHARKFLDFLSHFSLLRWKDSKHLATSDLKSNVYNYNYTFSVEIAPVCREDIVCLPKRLAKQLGDVSPLLLAYKVNSTISFIDPFTLYTTEMDTGFWHNPFSTLLDRTDMVEFYILDIELLGPTVGRFALAEATVILETDFGVRDRYFITRTHLGNILNVGDTCAGYDFTAANFNDHDIESLEGRSIPSEVILVRKTYPERRQKKKTRKWQLDSLTKEHLDASRYEEERARQQYEQFLRDLEEDPEMRSQVDLYRRDDDMMIDDTSDDDENFPTIRIEELQSKMNSVNLKT